MKGPAYYKSKVIQSDEQASRADLQASQADLQAFFNQVSVFVVFLQFSSYVGHRVLVLVL